MPPSSAAGDPPPPGSGPSTAASCVPTPVPVPVDGIPLSDRLLGMRRKEAGLYRAGDYFDRLRFLSARAEEAGLVGANGDAYVEELDSAVIEDRRERTCEWIFLVVDRCHSDRQVAEVAVSFLDRYVSSVVFRGEAADEGLRQAPPQPAPKPIPEAAEGSQPPLKRSRSFTALQEAGGRPAAPAATDIRVPAPPPAARSVTVTAPTSPSTPPLPAGAAARKADLPPAPTASHLRAVIEALSVTSFHLATLTALYLAMKLYEPRKIRLDRLACLSRGNFAAEDVAAMERRMLSSLAWAVHPPTRIDFLASFCGLLPAAAAPVGPPASSPGAGPDDGAVNADLYELARFFVELSVWDARFVHLDPSAAALGALFNAMGMIGEGRFPPSRKEAFLAALSAAAPGLFEVEGTEMDAVRARLDVVFEHSTEASSNGHEKFLRDLSAASSSSSSSSGTGDGPTPSSSSSAHPAAPEESQPETHPEKILTRESPVGVADLGMVGAVSP